MRPRRVAGAITFQVDILSAGQRRGGRVSLANCCFDALPVATRWKRGRSRRARPPHGVIRPLGCTRAIPAAALATRAAAQHSESRKPRGMARLRGTARAPLKTFFATVMAVMAPPSCLHLPWDRLERVAYGWYLPGADTRKRSADKSASRHYVNGNIRLHDREQRSVKSLFFH